MTSWILLGFSSARDEFNFCIIAVTLASAWPADTGAAAGGGADAGDGAGDGVGAGAGPGAGPGAGAGARPLIAGDGSHQFKMQFSYTSEMTLFLSMLNEHPTLMYIARFGAPLHLHAWRVYDQWP